MEVKRELLEQALAALDGLEINYGNLLQSSKTPEQLDEISTSIRAALSAPERKPMTLDEIKSNSVISYFGVESGEKIVRAVEAFHGITKG